MVLVFFNVTLDKQLCTTRRDVYQEWRVNPLEIRSFDDNSIQSFVHDPVERNMSSISSSKYEANASELLENLEEMFLRPHTSMLYTATELNSILALCPYHITSKGVFCITSYKSLKHTQERYVFKIYLRCLYNFHGNASTYKKDLKTCSLGVDCVSERHSLKLEHKVLCLEVEN